MQFIDYGNFKYEFDTYDTFSIIMESKWNRVGIDCLRGSGLIRIFLPPNEYVIEPYWHQIVKKEK